MVWEDGMFCLAWMLYCTVRNLPGYKMLRTNEAPMTSAKSVIPS